MKLGRVGLAALFTTVFPITVASAQGDDESDPATGVVPGGTIQDSDEVIGPDDGPAPPPDDEPDQPAAAGAKPTSGYDKGFFVRSADEKFTLRISGRLQPQLILTRVANPRADLQGRFQIRRARLTLDGNLHGKDLLYKFQSDFGRGFVSLKDLHVDVRLAGDTWLRAGQWKRPFSRQQITSSGRLELVDRAITDKIFGGGRDLGVALRNNYEKSPEIEWTVGVWNGTGEEPVFKPTFDDLTNEVDGGSFSNLPSEFKPVFIGRVGLNSPGIKGYSEADLEGGPLRWAAAASFWLETDFDADDVSNEKVQLDFIIKAQGFSTTGGIYALTQQTDVQTLSSQELALLGFHLQAGYMVTPQLLATARYALVTDREEEPTRQQEVVIGGSFFGWGHDAKLIGDVRFLKTGDSKLTDNVALELGANVEF